MLDITTNLYFSLNAHRAKGACDVPYAEIIDSFWRRRRLMDWNRIEREQSSTNSKFIAMVALCITQSRSTSKIPTRCIDWQASSIQFTKQFTIRIRRCTDQCSHESPGDCCSCAGLVLADLHLSLLAAFGHSFTAICERNWSRIVVATLVDR
jgi:hypothetical protein